MKKKYIVRLTKEEQCRVHEVISKGKVERGFQGALGRKKREHPPKQKLLDGRKEASLIALRSSEPPTGRARWTLRLLADTLVEFQVVDTISHETVRQTLKKAN